MRQLLLPTLILALFVFSCKNVKEYSRSHNKNPEKDKTNMVVNIKANNLSEDFSVFASKNDELMILIYEWQDSTDLSAPLFAWSTILDLENMSKKQEWKASEPVMNKKLIMAIFEIDSKASIAQIDPIFRVHHDAMIKAFSQRNYLTMQKYLSGNDDLLGIEFFEKSYAKQTMSFNISGMHKADKYEYLVEIRPQ